MHKKEKDSLFIDPPVLNTLGQKIIAHSIKTQQLSEAMLRILKYCADYSIDPLHLHDRLFKNNRLVAGTIDERRIIFLDKLEYKFKNSSSCFNIPFSELDKNLKQLCDWWQALGSAAKDAINIDEVIDFNIGQTVLTEYLGDNPNTWWRRAHTRLERLHALYIAYLAIKLDKIKSCRYFIIEAA